MLLLVDNKYTQYAALGILYPSTDDIVQASHKCNYVTIFAW